VGNAVAVDEAVVRDVAEVKVERATSCVALVLVREVNDVVDEVDIDISVSSSGQTPVLHGSTEQQP
jgi:hypothetical protein